MREVLVIANRTLGGAKLREAVRERAASGDVRFRLVVPQTKPSAGLVIYDEAVRESAQVRVDLALSAVAAEGIEATGEVGDGDPFSATMDAVAQHQPDEIILSTYPTQHSGWLRRDLVERVSNAAAVPVEHIVADIDQEGLSFKVTLVVSHKTSSGEELLAHLSAKASEDEPRLFIAVVPQLDGSGSAPREARERLASMLDRLHAAGLLSSGMIGDPDPYTATMNALELFHVDDVVISTLPGERSGWMRSRLIERVRGAIAVPVEHVVVDPLAATVAASAG
ncbi:MAG TPA: universal stress protein [Solirubrobacteraceae bacterium]|jgi:hypothetical protein|nr:universal stress protein [Solirubrobacteraceae bacterium]